MLISVVSPVIAYKQSILRKAGITMASYVSPAIADKFETLSVDLKNLILERNVQLNNMQDLIQVLEQIVEEGEAE